MVLYMKLVVVKQDEAEGMSGWSIETDIQVKRIGSQRREESGGHKEEVLSTQHRMRHSLSIIHGTEEENGWDGHGALER